VRGRRAERTYDLSPVTRTDPPLSVRERTVTAVGDAATAFGISIDDPGLSLCARPAQSKTFEEGAMRPRQSFAVVVGTSVLAMFAGQAPAASAAAPSAADHAIHILGGSRTARARAHDQSGALPWNESASGTYSFTSPTTLTGSGTVSGTPITGTIAFSLDCSSASGTGTLKTPGGDSITYSFSLQCSTTSSSGSFTITGGTGKFAGATGSGMLDATNGPGDTFSVTDVGTFMVSSGTSTGTVNWSTRKVIDSQPPFSNPDPLYGISCPTTDLCAAVGGDGFVITSTNPTGAGDTCTVCSWEPADIDDGGLLDGVSCPTTSLCVAVDNSGNVVTSTNPSGGAAAWTAANVDGDNSLTAVSCASATLCVAVDDSGNVVTSTNPTGGAMAWSAADVDGTTTLNAISCPTVTLCVAVDDSGGVLDSTDPTGGAQDWSLASGVDPGASLAGVDCPTTTLCVAVDDRGDVVTSTNPTGGDSAWSTDAVDGSSSLQAVSCPTAGLCVAVDEPSEHSEDCGRHAVGSVLPESESVRHRQRRWGCQLVDRPTR